jgi:hypothetical protein
VCADTPDPVIKPDEEYPEWVFKLTEPVSEGVRE